jgi:ribosomal protein L37AE/L43A
MAIPIGCEKCDHTGYKGRIGIYELFRLDDSIRTVVRTSGNIDQIREISRANGMHLMLEDAVEKLRAGMTTLEEIFRVVPTENVARLECPKCNEPIVPKFKYCPHCGRKTATPSNSSSSHLHQSLPEEVLQS